MKRLGQILLLLALASGAQGQFIGYVSPQTVQQTLATTTACTGSRQIFAVNNLGQIEHYLTVGSLSGVTNFRAEIDGVDTQGKSYRISEVLENPAISTLAQGGVFGSGYFPEIQVVVTCSPNTGTFSAAYAGGWGASTPLVGAYLGSQIDKINFVAAAENANQSDSTLQTPFGSSAGTIYFQAAGGTLSGASLTVTCNTSAFSSIGTATQPLSVSLTNTTSLQSFQVPDFACPFVTVSYGAGGSTSGTVTAEYVFTLPGLARPSYLYKSITSNTNTVVKGGPGFLHLIAVNNPGSAETLTIYDNTACSGTTIGTTSTGLTAGQSAIYDVQFFTGLCITSAGTTAGNWTVSYQ